MPTVTLNDSLPNSLTKGDGYVILGSYAATGPFGGNASCSSSINGVVTNTSSLTAGTHTITCTATTGASKTATVYKSVTVTYTAYTAKNLIINSNFINDSTGWQANTASTISVSGGDSNLYSTNWRKLA